MKKLLSILMLLISTFSFAIDVDLPKLTSYFESKDYKVKESQADDFNYVTYEKRDGQFYILVDLSLKNKNELSSIFIKSAHIHMSPNMKKIRSNLKSLLPFINQGIENKDLKDILTNSLSSLSGGHENEKFSENFLEGNNSVVVTISEKLPEVDFSEFFKEEKTE